MVLPKTSDAIRCSYIPVALRYVPLWSWRRYATLHFTLRLTSPTLFSLLMSSLLAERSADVCYTDRLPPTLSVHPAFGLHAASRIPNIIAPEAQRKKRRLSGLQLQLSLSLQTTAFSALEEREAATHGSTKPFRM